jgi:hypothetical protein
MTNDEFFGDLIKLYKSSCVGGNCHIVTDDKNVDDDSIRYCLNAVNKNYHEQSEELQAVELRILNHLLTIKEDDRYSLLDLGRDKIIESMRAEGWD